MPRVLLAGLLALPAGGTPHVRADDAIAQMIAQGVGPAGGPWAAPYYGRRGPPGPYAPYEAPPAAGRLDGEAAARMLRSRGFSDVSVLRQRGPTILLEASGPRGERVQVVVDAASGAISGMKVIGFGNQRY